jgi:hypothetical protein
VGGAAATGARVAVARVEALPGAPARVEVVAPFGTEVARYAALLAAPEPPPTAGRPRVGGRAVDLWAALGAALTALAPGTGRVPVVVLVVGDGAGDPAAPPGDAAAAWMRAHGARAYVVVASGLPAAAGLGAGR